MTKKRKERIFGFLVILKLLNVTVSFLQVLVVLLSSSLPASALPSCWRLTTNE